MTKKKRGYNVENEAHFNLRFIYIESQYFLGSSYAWENHRDLKADNVVPMEIAAKIEDKIRAGERFVVYLVVPLYPEGDPEGKVVQEILYWQWNTLTMMYARIGKWNTLGSFNVYARIGK